METPIFRAVYKDGIFFKKTMEIFYNSISKLVLTITQEGIFSRMTDSASAMLFDLELWAPKFDEFEHTRDLVFGMQTSHLQKIISSVKKNDTVKLEMFDSTSDSAAKLFVIITPLTGEYTDRGFVSTENVQVINIELPGEYSDVAIRGSKTKFTKMCKELNTISKDILVRGGKSYILFQAVVEGMIGRSTSYGEQKQEKEELNDVFRIEDFVRITKISVLGNDIFFSLKEGLPLKIAADIGSIGRIGVYVRTKRAILEDLN
jgi:DNA polymerase III sliding clamp (beta) subunit (PCNA family)